MWVCGWVGGWVRRRSPGCHPPPPPLSPGNGKLWPVLILRNPTEPLHRVPSADVHDHVHVGVPPQQLPNAVPLGLHRVSFRALDAQDFKFRWVSAVADTEPNLVVKDQQLRLIPTKPAATPTATPTATTAATTSPTMTEPALEDEQLILGLPLFPAVLAIVVMAVVVIVVGLALCWCWCWCRRRQRDKNAKQQNVPQWGGLMPGSMPGDVVHHDGRYTQ